MQSEIREFECKLTLTPSEAISGLSMDTVLMEKLKYLYEGRCDSGCLIEEVLEITKRSMIRVSRTDSSSDSSLSLKYIAKTSKYNTGDYIVGCVVSKTEKQNRILCTYGENIAIYVNDENDLDLIEGQKLIVRVITTFYEKGSAKISLGCSFYTPARNLIVYVIAEINIRDEEKEILKSLLENARELEKSITKSSEKFLDYFYPYKSIANVEKKLDILTLASDLIAGKKVSFEPYAILCSSAVIPIREHSVVFTAQSSEERLKSAESFNEFNVKTIPEVLRDNKKIKSTKGNVCSIFMMLHEEIYKYNDFMRMVNVCVETDESYNDLWEFYKNYKI